MTGKRRFARFSSVFVAASLIAMGCGSSPKTPDKAPPAPSGNLEATSPVARAESDGLVAELSPPEVRDGSIALVSVKLPPYLEGQVVTGEFEGIALPFFKDGDAYHAVLGVPYDHKAGAAVVQVRIGEGEGARRLEVAFTVVPGTYASEVLKVHGSKVRPQDPRALARIKREQAEIGEVYATVTPRKHWDGKFALPLDSAFTSRYGTRRVYNGVQKSAHLGLDFKAAVGTPIHASAPGRVVLSKDLFFTGNTVIVDHGYGVLTLYAHLSKLKARKGDLVKAGDLVGLAGMTGRVTGPHLHWMAIVHKQKVNPFDLTQVMK